MTTKIDCQDDRDFFFRDVREWGKWVVGVVVCGGGNVYTHGTKHGNGWRKWRGSSFSISGGWNLSVSLFPFLSSCVDFLDLNSTWTPSGVGVFAVPALAVVEDVLNFVRHVKSNTDQILRQSSAATFVITICFLPLQLLPNRCTKPIMRGGESV